MLNGLETVVYWAKDAQEAGRWYKKVLGIEPNYNEPYYVGFTVAGDELGIHPLEDKSQPPPEAALPITYWSVTDIRAAIAHFIEHGAKEHKAPQEVGGGIVVGSVLDPFGNSVGFIQNPQSPNKR